MLEVFFEFFLTIKINQIGIADKKAKVILKYTYQYSFTESK